MPGIPVFYFKIGAKHLHNVSNIDRRMCRLLSTSMMQWNSHKFWIISWDQLVLYWMRKPFQVSMAGTWLLWKGTQNTRHIRHFGMIRSQACVFHSTKQQIFVRRTQNKTSQQNLCYFYQALESELCMPSLPRERYLSGPAESYYQQY